MTAQEIADRFLAGETADAIRIRKLQALAERSRVDLAAVIALLPPDVQAHLTELNAR